MLLSCLLVTFLSFIGHSGATVTVNGTFLQDIHAAIAECSADELCDTVEVPAGIYNSSAGYSGGSVITIDPSHNMSIVATGGVATLEGNGRIMSISYTPDPVTIKMNGLSFVGGSGSGGALNFQSSNVEMTGCSFYGNNAGNDKGGAIFAGALLTLIDCTFVNNSALSLGGGAVFSTNGFVTMIRCVFTGNTAPTTALSQGAAVAAGGGALVLNSTFTRNVGRRGTVFSSSGDVTAHHSVFTSNVGRSGVALHGYNVLVTNCVFSDHAFENFDPISEFGGTVRGVTVNVSDSTFSGSSPDHVIGVAAFGGALSFSEPSLGPFDSYEGLTFLPPPDGETTAVALNECFSVCSNTTQPPCYGEEPAQVFYLDGSPYPTGCPGTTTAGTTSSSTSASSTSASTTTATTATSTSTTSTAGTSSGTTSTASSGTGTTASGGNTSSATLPGVEVGLIALVSLVVLCFV